MFVRFCEDNRLLGDPIRRVWITGNDRRPRGSSALDAENAFYRANPTVSYREWLGNASPPAHPSRPPRPWLTNTRRSASHPSSDAVNRILDFWRRTDDNGDLVCDFQDDELSTRFLGDLYQDLSEYAKKTYALLQTPEFVEEFILDQTLTPALDESALDGFKLIDPTCGSGHFLLGAFARLTGRVGTRRARTGACARGSSKALDAVHGVDLNPFAVAIARFRLIVAALQACGVARRLSDAPGFTLPPRGRRLAARTAVRSRR